MDSALKSIFKRILGLQCVDPNTSTLKNRYADLIVFGNISVSNPENLKLGHHVVIGDRCLLSTEGGITIGDYTQLACGVTIFSDEHLYDQNDFIPISNKKIKKPVLIEPFCIIGANSSILPGVTIGEGSIIGMGSVVTSNIPAHSVVFGNPARIIKKRDASQFSALKEEKKFFYLELGKNKWSYQE